MNRRPGEVPERIEIPLVSTRLVWPSGGMPTAFAPEALESMARQINAGSFLPMHDEHLAYLPPNGRIASARVEKAIDGALELYGVVETVPHILVREDPPESISSIVIPPSAVAKDSSAPFQLSIEPRNFEPDEYAKLVATAPFPVRPISKWSELPPLEILIVLHVTAGLAMGLGAFFKKFMEELGTEAGKAFADWIRSTRNRAKAPERELLLVARYVLPGGATIMGYIPVPVGSEQVIEGCLSSWVDLASFAEEKSALEAKDFQQMTFIHDGYRWHLAWSVTTGDAVYITPWGRANSPDPARFLPPGFDLGSRVD